MKYILMILLSVLVFTACSSNNTPSEPTPTETVKETPVAPETEVVAPEPASVTEESKPATLELTLEELAQYNGADGQPAYIAVDGIIYDVTQSDAWKNGQHNGFEAGKDLSEAIKNDSPHGISKLAGVIEIGILKN